MGTTAWSRSLLRPLSLPIEQLIFAATLEAARPTTHPKLRRPRPRPPPSKFGRPTCTVSSAATGSPPRRLWHIARRPVPISRQLPTSCLFAYQLAQSLCPQRRPPAHPLFLSSPFPFSPARGQHLVSFFCSSCYCILQTPQFFFSHISCFVTLASSHRLRFPALPVSCFFSCRLCASSLPTVQALTRYDAALTRTLRTAASFSFSSSSHQALLTLSLSKIIPEDLHLSDKCALHQPAFSLDFSCSFASALTSRCLVVC